MLSLVLQLILIHVQFYRIAFFLSLAFSAIGPLAALAMLHSWQEMLKFIGKFDTMPSSESDYNVVIGPVIPSLLSYLTGLVFYASHFPERVLPESVRRHLDYVGGGTPFPSCLLSMGSNGCC